MNLQNLFVLVSLLFLFIKIGYCQNINHNVIGTDGGYAENNQFTISYTIGELVTDFASDSSINIDLSQGFQQSFINLVSIENHVIDVDIDVFPNPAIDFLNVSVNPIHSRLALDIYDISGKLISHKDVNESKFQISFSALAAGNYLLVFSNNQNKLKTIKVQKSL